VRVICWTFSSRALPGSDDLNVSLRDSIFQVHQALFGEQRFFGEEGYFNTNRFEKYRRFGGLQFRIAR
jgi:hypothetical protein